MSGFIKPQLAMLKSKGPTGEQWLQEIKYDGNRVQGPSQLRTKEGVHPNGLGWTKRFTEIADALAISGEAIIDGEVVVVHEGRTNFPNSRQNSQAEPARLLRLRSSLAEWRPS